MTNMTPEKIAELKALCEKAAPGPYSFEGDGYTPVEIYAPNPKYDPNVIRNIRDRGPSRTVSLYGDQAEASLDLAENCRETINDLIAALEAEREKNEKLREAMNGAMCIMSAAYAPREFMQAEYRILCEALNATQS